MTHSLTPAKYTQDGVNPANVSTTLQKQVTLDGTVAAESDSPHGNDADIVPGPSWSVETDLIPSSSNLSAYSAKLKLSDHAMVSLIAETITKPEEITVKTPRKVKSADEELCELSYWDREVMKVCDDAIYSEFGIQDAKSLAG